MGCAQSKIENEEAVTRCKERKQFMKEALTARNAFAAAHSAYAMALKHTGAVLSDYFHGEFLVSSDHSSLSAAAAIASTSSLPSALSPASSAAPVSIPQPINDTLPPPPPPLPDALPPPPPPLQRAATMPEIKGRSGGSHSGNALNGTIIEEDGTIDDDDDDDDLELENCDRLIRKSRRRGGSNRGGKTIIEDHHQEEKAPPPPPANPRSIPPPRQHQQQQEPFYDFFFPSVENMPGNTLEDTPQPQPQPQPTRPVPPRPHSPVTEDEEEEDEEEEEEDEDGEEEEEKEEIVLERKPPVEERSKRVEEVSADLEKASNFRGMQKNKGTGIAGERRGGRISVTNLANVFNEIDDSFLKASESAHEVSKMLEATRLHYHSNFADNRSHIDHSARVMRVITWNRSNGGPLHVDPGKDGGFDSEENETHATVLDKLLAWEKKLYDEVKAGELMKIEYRKKVAHLDRVKNGGSHSDSLERAKAAVSHLHTRYIVDMQSLDSTASEINHLRDEQLYLKLVHLVEAMGKMWEVMQMHHQRQAEISKVFKSLDVSQAVKETNNHHHERTSQLLAVVQEWHTHFCSMIDHQKEYIKSLGGWLKLNLIPIESTLKEKVSSPPRVPNPAIQKLLQAWYDRLDKVPDEMARTAIINFEAVVSTIKQQQEDEIKLRDRCEETRKELGRKGRQFEDWYHKYMQKKGPEEIKPDGSEANNEHKDEVAVRQFNVEQIKKRLKEEEEAYQRQSYQVREKSLASLRTRLPELFQTMSEVAYSCSDMYRAVASVTQRQNERHQKPSQARNS